MTYSTWHKRLGEQDRALFHFAATRHWPAAEAVLPRLSRAANHGVLWFAAAGAMGATRAPRARRAALRGVTSLALASLTVNTVAKRAVRRDRPLLDAVPLVRQLKHRPITTSFPSGHSASAAAFVTGVALESWGWGAVMAPVGVSVAASRVYTGVHYPGDVMVGAALGVGAAFAVRGLVPTPKQLPPLTQVPPRTQLPPPGGPYADAPVLPEGRDMVIVVDRASGTARTRAALVREALPLAEVVECDPDDLPSALDKAARRGLALGVCGGDDTVDRAAVAAARAGVPLAVFPGGALNHIAHGLGIEEVKDTCRALASGDAVRVDLGRFGPGPGGGLLGVRAVRGGRLPGLRLLAAALAGPLNRTPLRAVRRMSRLSLSGVSEGTPLACDGEVTDTAGQLTSDKRPESLTVYRPTVHL
ncbi:phosphatase PAP2 family protein [Streptomyces sp. NPDC048416]|uniref:phosphatase PAP2 family protein n=1 Tax=Streptomyces sp. NPDC048416 TaxID=3365546 RepID=UPI00371E53C2